MKEQPVLETRRLVLRPLMAKDDLSVRELANDPQIAGMSLWYMHGAGRKVCRYWINGTHESWKHGTGAECAIELKDGGEMLGLAGLEAVRTEHASADLTFLVKSQVCRIRTRRHPRPPQPRPTGWLVPYGPAPVFAS
jgi:hypothetical protein